MLMPCASYPLKVLLTSNKFKNIVTVYAGYSVYINCLGTWKLKNQDTKRLKSPHLNTNRKDLNGSVRLQHLEPNYKTGVNSQG